MELEPFNRHTYRYIGMHADLKQFLPIRHPRTIPSPISRTTTFAGTPCETSFITTSCLRFSPMPRNIIDLAWKHKKFPPPPDDVIVAVPQLQLQGGFARLGFG
ncbi:hypothetical protein NE237_029098 [Protea cynaroides]|uniref:Uncharacterized protein n=1 Tax=Protea cynaroides TaxID=273540 RepID=A0A9Q0GQJ7_9MAGN|nr:hypothetical protein NE237_029098 [Protea cynaroides]